MKHQEMEHQFKIGDRIIGKHKRDSVIVEGYILKIHNDRDSIVEIIKVIKDKEQHESDIADPTIGYNWSVTLSECKPAKNYNILQIINSL